MEKESIIDKHGGKIAAVLAIGGVVGLAYMYFTY